MDFKKCPSCKEAKPVKEFHKDPRNKTGLTSWCNSCRRAKNKEWIKNNPEKAKNSRKNTFLKRTYGITLKDYEKLLKQQNNLCAICKTDTPGGKGNTFVVDHCHATGNIRGLLCNKCNLAIGLLNENPVIFDSAKQYLKYHSQVAEYGECDPDLI